MKNYYFLNFLLVLLLLFILVLNNMNCCIYKIFGYLGNKVMVYIYNDLFKYFLVNVSKELMFLEFVYFVYDELC